MFTINDRHLEMLSVALQQFETIWIHGNGQMFVDKKGVEEKFQASFLHKEFSPHNNDGGLNPAKYRLQFKQGDKIPESVEAITNVFLSKQGQELIEASRIKEETKTDYVIMPKKTKKNKE